MRNYLLAIMLGLAGFFSGQPMALAGEPLRVVTSTLDLADFVKEIGGDRVKVDPLTQGKNDLHSIDPRPSFVAKIQKADLVVVTGMELDAWMPALLDAARNSKVRAGAIGYVDASKGIHPLHVPEGKIDGSMGDVHPHGNPHYWWTLENVRQMIENIGNGLTRIDPEGESYYTANKNRYWQRVEAVYGRLVEEMRAYQGTPVVQFHESWDYFCETFGLRIIGQLELKPGIPPSAAHLQDLVSQAKSEEVKVLIAERYYPNGPIDFFTRNAQVPVVRLSNFVGGNPEASTYLENLENNVNLIKKVLAGM